MTDLLIAEIGSTTTVVNAFDGVFSGRPTFLGQGVSPTTVLEGDVVRGLEGAIDDLTKKLGAPIEYREMLATSSAAGGLRMTVHGLVPDMTVKAAREAALGAGANICMTTSGKLSDFELARIKKLSPNVILIAGGTDYGERETALFNAEAICKLGIPSPVIYAGNVQNAEQVKAIFEGVGCECFVAENVYPRLDELNVEPTRRIIQRVFERHITEAPGMGRVRELVTSSIMPTPGAVMQAAKLFYETAGDVMVVDVGGATTDVHSVTEGSPEINAMQIYPEPFAKRTVEGDLGVFVNARSLCEIVGVDKIERELGYPVSQALDELERIPKTERQQRFACILTGHAASLALSRHCGKFRYVYGESGRKAFAEGKDLSALKYIVSTGGALTRLDGRKKIAQQLRDANADGRLLFPKPDTVRLVEDKKYIMASLGVMSLKYPEAAVALLKDDLGL